MSVYASLNCFNSGELSPKMLGRNDVSQYSKGCRILKNFLVTPYGSVERRPGTKFIGYAKNFSSVDGDVLRGKIRLIRFVFSSEVSYVCEFGNRYIRFITNGDFLRDSNGIVEITTPYTAEEISEIQYVQSADVMTIVHQNHPVYELKRVEEDRFILELKEYEYPPMLDPNIDDDHTITPSGLTGDISLTASKDTFTSGNVGGYFQLIHTRKNNEISYDFTSDGTTESIEVFGYWTFTTHGTWSGNVKIQRSFDGGNTWSDFRTYSSAKDSNTSTSGEEEVKNVLYRISMTDYAASDTGTLKMCRILFVNPDFQTTGIVKINSVESTTKANGTVLSKLGDTAATSEWNEGAWSNRRGYPRTVSYYEERMMFGGTVSRPQTVWGSKTGDWDNFLVGSKDDDGLEFTLSSNTVNTILWMCQHDALIIGTMDSEWTLSAANSESALTASNFVAKRQSVYGSKGIPAQMVGETVLFVQRGGRKVREFVFQWEKNGYSSPDMTILADHITESGIVETALQQLPDSILWCVLGDGTVSALTYERDQEVVGWHRHITDGKIISCCVIPTGDKDTVYFAVDRGGKICIEEMMPREFYLIPDAFYVDCGKKLTGTEISVVDGLDHLEGKRVQVLADGAVTDEYVVEEGRITLSEPAQTVTVGLGYDSVLSPMPIEIEMQNGQSVLRKKCICNLRIRFYGSVGGQARCGNDIWQNIFSRDMIEDNMDSAIQMRDDVVSFNILSGNDYTPVIEVRQRDPLPMNVNSMVALYDVSER